MASVGGGGAGSTTSPDVWLVVTGKNFGPVGGDFTLWVAGMEVGAPTPVVQ
jgi:hypothetical protein